MLSCIGPEDIAHGTEQSEDVEELELSGEDGGVQMGLTSFRTQFDRIY